MSDKNINSSLVFRIREERERRPQPDPLAGSRKRVNFALTYEELYTSTLDQQIEDAKVKIRDRLMPLRKLGSGRKDKQYISHLNQAKKISLNFELFNPRKRCRQQQDEGKNSFQELFNLSKEKYLERIEKYKRKQSEKCKNNSVFGLNIKTVDQNNQKVILRREVKTRDPFGQQCSQKDIKSHLIPQQNGIDKNFPVTQHKTRRQKQQRSKSFALQSNQLREFSFIKIKLFKMVNSNNIVLQSFGVYLIKPNQLKFKYYVGNGNNKNLIKAILKQRWWWTETNDINTANFIWTQLKHALTIDRQRICGQQNRIWPVQTSTTSNDKQKNIQTCSFFHPKLNKFLHKYGTQNERKKYLIQFHIPECVHNHFSHNFMVGNKNALFQNLSQYYQYLKQNVFTIIPLTFFVQNPHSFKFQEFLNSAQNMKNTVWIIKPGENSNRGNGIFVSKSVDQIKRKLLRKKSGHTFIIQKYMTNLLLYNKRKFDIRTYLLMLSIGGATKFFWYEQGYIRTSSQIFDLKNLSDTFVHLTNDAVQKRCQNYGKFENGNKLSFNQFQRYLQSNYPDKDYKMKDLNETMKSIALQVVKATYKKIDPQLKQYGFQLFGLDFVVDINFRPWLIEVNTNPCLQLSSPTLERLIPRMMQNLFRIAVDPVFQANDDIPRSKSYYIYDNCLEKNRFQLIFDSLFDRDYQWQLLIQGKKERIYSENVQEFQGDGVQINAIY